MWQHLNNTFESTLFDCWWHKSLKSGTNFSARYYFTDTWNTVSKWGSKFRWKRGREVVHLMNFWPFRVNSWQEQPGRLGLYPSLVTFSALSLDVWRFSVSSYMHIYFSKSAYFCENTDTLWTLNLVWNLRLNKSCIRKYGYKSETPSHLGVTGQWYNKQTIWLINKVS